uniref:Uncharacterized protein n=1 Tax=Plectus sambesii TaxID=2011161 RepID=A0A914XEY8_9BILA
MTKFSSLNLNYTAAVKRKQTSRSREQKANGIGRRRPFVPFPPVFLLFRRTVRDVAGIKANHLLLVKDWVKGGKLVRVRLTLPLVILMSSSLLLFFSIFFKLSAAFSLHRQFDNSLDQSGFDYGVRSKRDDGDTHPHIHSPVTSAAISGFLLVAACILISICLCGTICWMCDIMRSYQRAVSNVKRSCNCNKNMPFTVQKTALI